VAVAVVLGVHVRCRINEHIYAHTAAVSLLNLTHLGDGSQIMHWQLANWLNQLHC
jgi:hypothetical protein